MFIINTKLTMFFKLDDKTKTMIEKYPRQRLPKACLMALCQKEELMKYPLRQALRKNSIIIFKGLIGQKLTLKYEGKEYKLKISGIFNAGYDDFIVSSDVEQKFYKNIKDKKCYSISYDVTRFDDIVSVSEMLKAKDIDSKNVSSEIAALQNTFNSLSRLFLIVSILILAIGLFISVILLVKLQNSRYRELGLLSALGFSKGTIRRMIICENILLSGLASVFNAVLIGCIYVVSIAFDLNLVITILQMFLSFLRQQLLSS